MLISSKFELPQFETTPESLVRLIDDLIETGKTRMAELGAQNLASVSFESTLGALDDLAWTESCALSQVHLLHNVSPKEDLRAAAQDAIMKFQSWSIERAYDPKIYAIVKAYASKNEKLNGEKKKLLEETLRDFKRLGLDLPLETQTKLKGLQQKLSEIETQFSAAINDHHDEVAVSREELSGLDEEFIQSLKKTADGKFRISLQYPEYLPAMEFAQSESLRKALLTKKFQTGLGVNSTRLNEMIHLRKEIASILGYRSWNHYVIEERMAKTPETVFDFILKFEEKLRPKANRELSELKKLKIEMTKNPSAEIHLWDYYFYASLYKKKNFEVDTRSLREFFPLDQVLTGFFQMIERLFDIRFEEQKSGTFESWDPEVRLFKVFGRDQNELGAFYLDLFPRKGKFGHAAAFGLIEGKLLSNGVYQRPVKAMVCNFTREAPHLLSHAEVETLFHEFGHILHGLLTWAQFARFSGTSVVRDFVEAPSQVLENWAWDFEILQMIAKHYKDSSKKISKDLVDRMDLAQKAGMGLFYLRQISFAKADLAIHAEKLEADPLTLVNRVASETFLPPPEGTNIGPGFGHLVGYASGYYGYAWADVMAADMFSLFKAKGLLDRDLGLRLRKEVYEPGGSRDENVSLERFLQRPMSYDAFFEGIGV